MNITEPLSMRKSAATPTFHEKAVIELSPVSKGVAATVRLHTLNRLCAHLWVWMPPGCMSEALKCTTSTLASSYPVALSPNGTLNLPSTLVCVSPSEPVSGPNVPPYVAATSASEISNWS